MSDKKDSYALEDVKELLLAVAENLTEAGVLLLINGEPRGAKYIAAGSAILARLRMSNIEQHSHE